MENRKAADQTRALSTRRTLHRGIPTTPDLIFQPLRIQTTCGIGAVCIPVSASSCAQRYYFLDEVIQVGKNLPSPLLCKCIYLFISILFTSFQSKWTRLAWIVWIVAFFLIFWKTGRNRAYFPHKLKLSPKCHRHYQVSS